MKLKKKLLITLGVIIAVVFISGASILAATTLGTQTDPLVTLSYLSGKLKPQIMTDVNASISSAQASLSPALDTKINTFKSDIESRLNGSSATAASFTLVTLNNNQTLTCGVGTEVLLRLGTATAVGVSPALVDSTSSTTLTAGAALTPNHMYLVTIQSNGLMATSSSVKVLVRGAYIIS